MQRTISFMKGTGSTNHNDRVFITENVDKERIQYNITYCNEKIEDAYHKLFDEALEKFNARQTRNDRRIENYYEKIRTGKQENPFEEVIVQIGDKDNMGAETKNGQLAKKILDEYMKGFAERNPYMYVFSAHLHMDEATPHLHIDFIPFTTGSKRGLETRVSLKAALQKQGFNGGTKSCTERNEWYESEKVALSKIMLEHGIMWEQKGTHEKHKSVSEFKKQKLIEEVESLKEQKEEIEHKISAYNGAEKYAMLTATKLKDNADIEIKEPLPLMTAKTYKSKIVMPFINNLIKIIQDLARRCYRAEKEEQRADEKISKLYEEKEHYKSRAWNLNKENSQLKVQLRDFDKIKEYLGIDKVKELLKTINASRQKRSEPER